jgi:hypothetical protein
MAEKRLLDKVSTGVRPNRSRLDAARSALALASPLLPFLTASIAALTADGIQPFALPFRNATPGQQPLTLPGSTDAALAVKTERLPPTGYPPLRQCAEALLTASLGPHWSSNGQRGRQPGDLTARKDTGRPGVHLPV